MNTQKTIKQGYGKLILIHIMVLVSGLLLGQENNKSLLQKIHTSGNIQAGVEYGLLPFLVNLNPPQTNFTSQGSISFQALKLPFNLDYYYSSLGSISGLNNYVSFRFDANKYINDKKKALLSDKMDKLNKIDSLNAVKQGYLKKIDYYTLLANRKIAYPSPNAYTQNIEQPNFQDSLSNYENMASGAVSDSISNLTDTYSADTSGLNNEVQSKKDSIIMPYEPSKEELDSVRNEINKYYSLIQKIDNTVEEYQKFQNLSIDSITSTNKDKYVSKQKKNLQQKFGHFFNGVKRFDIGMTYPNYSRFLISGIPIRGFNMEYEYNNFYFAFTTGKTVNNIFITNNIINNNLNSIRNAANFFDFNNYNSGRKITALKVGYGKKNGTHFYVGGLKGIGKANYSDTSSIYDIEQNLVGELDGQVKIGKKQTLQALYGRSALQLQSIGYEDTITLIDKLVSLKDRTNALKLNYKIQTGKTKLQATYRLIDPFYKSYGVGFLRSDNQRFALKIQQKITKKFDINLNYRRENDNVIKLYNYQNVILTYGAGFTYRPVRKFLIKGDFRPILQQANLGDSSVLSTNNYITNVVVNYLKRVKKTNIMLTAVNSYYRLSTENGLFEFFNINFNSTIDFNQKFVNTTVFNHYSTTDTTSVPLASILTNEFSVKLKKVMISLKGKASLAQNNTLSTGYGAKLHYQPSKNFFIELSSEKLVLGDFYNSLLEHTNTYYYYSYASIGIKW